MSTKSSAIFPMSTSMLFIARYKMQRCVLSILQPVFISWSSLCFLLAGMLPPPHLRQFALLKLNILCLLQFWELDTDHDFFICKEDLLRYGNHSLTYRIVDRIFSQVMRLLPPSRPNLPVAS